MYHHRGDIFSSSILNFQMVGLKDNSRVQNLDWKGSVQVQNLDIKKKHVHFKNIESYSSSYIKSTYTLDTFK